MTHNFNTVSRAEIIANWDNENWYGWHSLKYAKAHAKNKNVIKDDRYIRDFILSKFPITCNTLSLKEIKSNWHNAAWWQENLHNVINIFDSMYIKKGVKSCGGIYSSWLTRLTQYVITRDAEEAVAKLKGFDWNEAGHTNIHTGRATAEEAQPDFTDANGDGVELKVCENESSIVYYYFRKLKKNFKIAKQVDFHGASRAIFFTKACPHKLYEIALDDIDDLVLSIGEDIPLETINTKNGKIINEADLPAVPKALLFGLTPTWSKNK